MKVTRDETDWTYRIEGDPTEYPSVTRALSTVIRDYEWLKEDVRRRTMARGRAVHRMVEIIEGHYDGTGLSNLDPRLLPYRDAWLRFKDQSRYEPEKFEIPFVSKKWGYGGTVDTYGTMPGDGRVLIDIKTGKPPWWVGRQTGAYANGIMELEERETGRADSFTRYCLWLQDSGQPRLIPNRGAHDLGVFLNYLSVYRDMKNHDAVGGGNRNGLRTEQGAPADAPGG